TDGATANQVVIGTSLANGTGSLQATQNAALANVTGAVVLLGANNYSGGTLVNRGMNLVLGTGGALGAPLGTGAVTVWGTLTAAGTNGSFLSGDGTGNNNANAITLNPGSALVLDSTNAYGALAADNNTNRWGDTTPIALNGATLELLGLNAAGTATTE